MSTPPSDPVDLLVVGAGPAGLAAAEAALQAGCRRVQVWEAGPRAGRKFLLAGRSGLNLTRDCDAEAIIEACGAAGSRLADCIAAHPPRAICAWAAALGHPTFVGTSGKVFPRAMQGTGLLADWLQELSAQGLELAYQRRIDGIQRSDTGMWQCHAGAHAIQARSVILALGGGSWPTTGSDAAWQPWLQAMGVAITPLSAANCGVEIPWDEHIRSGHAGAALKNLSAQVYGNGTLQGSPQCGEAVITSYGLEGYCVYPLIPAIRTALQRGQEPRLVLDLARGRSVQGLAERLQRQASASFANRLRKAARLSPAQVALLRQWLPPEQRHDPMQLAQCIKGLSLPVTALRPLAEAISTAGGVAWPELDDGFMLHQHPGLSCVGEMVDWEAPTGGYLLSVCLAMGRHAGIAAAQRLGQRR